MIFFSNKKVNTTEKNKHIYYIDLKNLIPKILDDRDVIIGEDDNSKKTLSFSPGSHKKISNRIFTVVLSSNYDRDEYIRLYKEYHKYIMDDIHMFSEFHNVTAYLRDVRKDKYAIKHDLSYDLCVLGDNTDLHLALYNELIKFIEQTYEYDSVKNTITDKGYDAALNDLRSISYLLE